MSGRTPNEGRYSKISRRMWGDEGFQALSAPQPNAQSLWQRLLSGPELGCIPGLFPARLGGLADALKWPLKATRRCWDEIAAQSMAEADWDTGLVWVPNAIVHNEPQSTNTVIGWRLALRELPECELKHRALASIRFFLEQKGPQWAKAFDMASAKSSPKASAMPSPMTNGRPSRNQEQDTGARDPKEPTTTQGSEPVARAPLALVVVAAPEDPGAEHKIPCPADLKLTPAQRSTLEGSFVPGYAIDALSARFVMTATADPADRRPLAAWLKCMAIAIQGNWNNPKTRPPKPEVQVAPKSVEDQRQAAQDLEDRARRQNGRFLTPARAPRPTETR